MLKGKIYLQKIVKTNEYWVGDILTISILKAVEDEKDIKYLSMKKTGQDMNDIDDKLDLKNNLLLSEKDFVNLSEKNIYLSRVIYITESSIPGMNTLIIEIDK